MGSTGRISFQFGNIRVLVTLCMLIITVSAVIQSCHSLPVEGNHNKLSFGFIVKCSRSVEL